MPGLWWAKGRSVSKYTIKFHGTGGHCFGVIYKDDVEVWRDKPWPDDGSAEQAGYEKLKKLEREDNPYILYDEQDMSRAAWLYFAIEVTLTSADIQPEDVDDALREIADDLWLEMSEDERAAADERATTLNIKAPRSLGLVDSTADIGSPPPPRAASPFHELADENIDMPAEIEEVIIGVDSGKGDGSYAAVTLGHMLPDGNIHIDKILRGDEAKAFVEEADAVQQLCKEIGYGRTMQLAAHIFEDELGVIWRTVVASVKTERTEEDPGD